MSFFDNLGLGGILGGISSPDYWGAQRQQLAQQQSLRHFSICIHGLNCPMCREQAENALKSVKQTEKLLAKRKLDYQNRCKIYIKKFRAGYKLTKHK